MNEITININEANKAQKYQDEKELFQIDAFRKVADILKEHKVNGNVDEITDCRFHDTIFIDGDRGVGKTAFMINIENYYKNIAKMETPKYIFLKSVDPTLLEHTEKFLGVILARIVEKVAELGKDSQINSKYYECLEKVSKSLSAISSLTKSEDVGIEEIASNKSSLKLEQHAHEFFQIVSTMFGVNAIVMLIDDVDMAFDKGFDVLEVVRKYLASPYLIPIVAGDMKLYREIVETRFKEKIQFFNDVKYLKDVNTNTEALQESREYQDKLKLLNNLVEQYLHKVFPSEYHIKLKDMFSILKSNIVTIEINGIKVRYQDLKDFEIRVINWGINQKEFTHQVFTNNTRDFVQYLFHKKAIYTHIFDKEFKSENYKDEKESSSIISNRFDSLIKEKIVNKPEEHKKSLKLTADFYRYSNDIDKKRLSMLLDNDVEAFTDNGYSIYKALRGNFFLNEKSPYNKIDREIVRDRLYVPKERYLELNTENSPEYLALYLMLHDNYYANITTKWLFITGKFLETMICIMDATLNSENKKEIINRLNYSLPIFSGINKNKYIDKLKTDNSNSKQNLNNDNYELFLGLFEQVKEIKFTSIFLYEMVKKYINNINIFKVKDYSKDISEIDNEVNNVFLETPIYDSVKRVIYIFLNSIASFESRNNITTENIAVDGDVENIEKVSKTYINNIKSIQHGSLTEDLNRVFTKVILSKKDDKPDSIFNASVESKNTIINELKNLGFNPRTSNHVTKLNVMKRFIEKIQEDKYSDHVINDFKRTVLDKEFQDKFVKFTSSAKGFDKSEYDNTVSELLNLLNA